MTTTLAPEARIAWSQIVDRQTGLLTPEQNEVIRRTKVLMLGIGGMGMNAAAHLIRAGFEQFTLVDFDVVDGTSANRTPFSFDDTLGQQKVDATRYYMLKVNPAAQIRALSHVKLGLNSDPEFIRQLVEEHDVLSWAMDGMAGRIHYTRIAHEVGSRHGLGKPAIESWGVPYHFCVWTIPNTAGSPTWERFFNLPTAGQPASDISPEQVTEAQKVFLKGFAGLPQLSEALPSDILDKWLNLRISNRTFGPFVVGCTVLIAYEILQNALRIGGVPLEHSRIHRAPWMVFYDARRNTSFEYNFQTRRLRWVHPLTGQLVEETR